MTSRDLLARVPLFAGTADAELDRIAAVARPDHFAPGDLLLRAGDAADHLHVVIDGRVALSLHVPGRGDLVVETLGPGDVVGVSWALPDQRWELDARAMGAVDALTLDGDHLRAEMDADGPLGRAIQRGVTLLLGERLHATRLRLLDLYRGEGAG